MILVDSNIWIDLIQRDPDWVEWSLSHVQIARAASAVCINAVIYAELAPNYDSAADLDRFLNAANAAYQPISPKASYLAGRAFLKYRGAPGRKSGVLPDFFIGAQAQAEGWTILTRDKGRYKTYFPGVKLICP